MVSIIDCGSIDPCSIHGLPKFFFDFILWIYSLFDQVLIDIINLKFNVSINEIIKFLFDNYKCDIYSKFINHELYSA